MVLLHRRHICKIHWITKIILRDISGVTGEWLFQAHIKQEC